MAVIRELPIWVLRSRSRNTLHWPAAGGMGCSPSSEPRCETTGEFVTKRLEVLPESFRYFCQKEECFG